MCNCIKAVEEQVKCEKEADFAQFDHYGSKSSEVRYMKYKKGSSTIFGNSRYISVGWRFCPFCGDQLTGTGVIKGRGRMKDLDNKVEELMEQKAKQLYKRDVDCIPIEYPLDWDVLPEKTKNGYRKEVAEFLSDLALIDQTCYTYKETGKKLAYVIPLSEIYFVKSIL